MGGDPEEKRFKLRPKGRAGVCWLEVTGGGDSPSQREEASWLGSIIGSSFNPSWRTTDQPFSSSLDSAHSPLFTLGHT